METLKKNVDVFNSNVESNKGYIYTTDAPLSSQLANGRMSKAVLSMINDKVKTLIDIGSGDGTYANEILEKKPNLSISGFDPAEVAVKIASEKYPKIEFFVGNIYDASTFPKKKFDLGVIRGVLHHTNNPQLAIANSALMANELIIVEPNGNNPVLKVIEKVSPYHREHEEQSFSSSLLKKWCKESGYEVIKLDFIGFVPMFFPAFLSRIIYFFQPFFEKIYPLKKYLGAQIVILCRKTDNAETN